MHAWFQIYTKLISGHWYITFLMYNTWTHLLLNTCMCNHSVLFCRCTSYLLLKHISHYLKRIKISAIMYCVYIYRFATVYSYFMWFFDYICTCLTWFWKQNEMFYLLIHAAMMVANNAEHKSVWSDTVAALNVITGFNICHRELFFFVTFILCSQGKKIFIKKIWHLFFFTSTVSQIRRELHYLPCI